MTNSEYLTVSANNYLSAVAEANAEYQSTMARIADLSGSERYDKEAGEAESKRNDAIGQAQKAFTAKADSALNGMLKAIDSRAMDAPTDSQMRILELLRNRESVSREELDSAANSLKDSPAALESLTEIAHRNGIHTDYSMLSKQIGTGRAKGILEAMSGSLRELAQSTARPGVEKSLRYHTEHYGGAMPHASELPQVERFRDNHDLIKRCGLKWGEPRKHDDEYVGRFLAAVDADS